MLLNHFNKFLDKIVYIQILDSSISNPSRTQVVNHLSTRRVARYIEKLIRFNCQITLFFLFFFPIFFFVCFYETQSLCFFFFFFFFFFKICFFFFFFFFFFFWYFGVIWGEFPPFYLLLRK